VKSVPYEKMNSQNQNPHNGQSDSKVNRFMSQHDEHNPISFAEQEKQRQIDAMWEWRERQNTKQQQENA